MPAAYAVARLRFIGRGVILYLFLVIQMFSPVIVVISLFKIMAGFGLLGMLKPTPDKKESKGWTALFINN